MEILVIGGGASGMLFTSLVAKKTSHRIYLIEKNEKLGKKIYITGKGRCNVTNAIEPREFLDNIITNPKFMYSAISKFTPYDTMEFFEKNNIPLKVERGNRVFPVSDKASDIIKGLERSLKTDNVEVHINENVTSVLKESNKYKVKTNVREYVVDIVVFATGGASYPTTGSTGDGYKILKNLSHTINPLYPALVGIILNYPNIDRFAGVSLKNIGVRIIDSHNKVITDGFGECLFTHKGISGPQILTMSSYINKRDDISSLKVVLDLKPVLSEEALDKRILRDLDKYKNSDLKNALKDLLISSLLELVLEQSKINPNIKANSLLKTDRVKLLKTIKSLKFDIESLESLKTAVVTSGGVDVKEVNNTSMESKLNPNLYILGELLDVDAKTGGFNLQLAFSQAAAAANDIVKKYSK